MGDQHEGQAAAALQVRQQVEDLRLHRDVQGRGRLVEDDDVRVRRQGPGNGDALALAAGELVRVALQVFAADAYLLRHLGGDLTHLCHRGVAQGEQRLGDDLPDRQARVEGRLRVLEHDLHVAVALAVAGVGPAQVAAAGLDQAHEQLRQGALAAARFADDAQGFPGAQFQVDAVQGMGEGPRPAQPVVAQGKAHLYIVEAQQRLAAGPGLRSIHWADSGAASQQALLCCWLALIECSGGRWAHTAMAWLQRSRKVQPPGR